MKCVFEAPSGLEAHMVFNLLQQEGIDGRVDGEYLQGGVGELQAMNIVRVLVDEADVNKARAIIDAWESKQTVNTENITPGKNSSGFGIGALFGLLIGIAVTFWAYNSPVSHDGVDYNDDGKVDVKWTYKDNRTHRVDTDRNLDGKIDVIHYYNRKGLVFKTESDDDFDGVYETKYKYKRGNPYLQESDLNQDGHIDYRAHFADGLLTAVEIRGPDLNAPAKKQLYRMHKLISAEYDANGDGVYEAVYEYDYYEELKAKSNKAFNKTKEAVTNESH